MCPKSPPWFPNIPATIQPGLHPSVYKGQGRRARLGSRNALSTRETEPAVSLMESNQSQALESPIAMAAEFPESDKARSPSLPSQTSPPLPFPRAAGTG